MNNHTHCIICGDDFPADEDGNLPHTYICPLCNSSFPGDYLLYRMSCWENGVHRREFDILEYRLNGIPVNTPTFNKERREWAAPNTFDALECYIAKYEDKENE